METLADRTGYTVTYSGGGTSVQRDRGSRSRLVAANAAAQEFYATALESEEAAPARKYLTERNSTPPRPASSAAGSPCPAGTR